MSLEDDVNAWTDEAFRTLEKARQLSALAQAVLESTDHILTNQLPKRLELAESLMSKTKNLQANVTALVEHLRAKVQHGVIEPHAKAMDQLLRPALAQLDKALTVLASTSVPLYLINETSGKKPHQYLLSDFVSFDVIDKLKGNIAIYTDNCNKARKLLEHHLEQLLEAAHKNSSKFSRCAKIYDSQVVNVQMLMRYANSTTTLPQSNSNIVNNILRENSSLEQELVSLLEMLTNHYDQCVLAKSLLTSSSNNIDLDVLRNDTLELPAVLKEFLGIHDIIMNNETRAAKFVDQKLPHIDSVIGHCDELIQAYTQFKSGDIVKLILLMVRCEEVLRTNSVDEVSTSGMHTVEVYTEVVSQLSHHYTQFHAIYEQKYLTELHYEQYVYPRKYLKLLNEFLNGGLLQLEEEERQRRHEWLQKYGNFIPKDFLLPGEYNQPSVVQVVSEGLDDIQSSSAEQDEARLLELMQHMWERQK